MSASNIALLGGGQPASYRDALRGAPANTAIAVLGDSRAAAETRESGGILYNFCARGPLTWANALAGQVATFQFADNLGIGGDTTAQVLARVQDVIARRPSICICFFGTNDPKDTSGPIALADSIANMYATWDALRNAGIEVVIIRDTPRTDAAWALLTTTPVLSVRRQLAALDQAAIRYARANRGVYIVGPPGTFATITTGEPASGMTYDGTHPSSKGAYQIASAGGLSSLLTTLLPPRQDLWSVYGDSYDATTNPYGNLLTNPRFTSGGSAPTSPLTGVRPDSWTCTRNGAGTLTGTLVGSMEAATDGGGDWWVMTASSAVLSTGSTSESLQALQSVTFPAGIADGDVLEGLVQVQIAASPTRLVGVTLQCNEADGSGGTAVDYVALEQADGYTAWPADALTLTLRTPQITVRPVGGGGARAFIWRVITRFDNAAAAAASFVVKMRCPSLRRI